MCKKVISLIMVTMLLFSVCSYARVGSPGITIGGTTILEENSGFVGYLSILGSVVTINAKLYGPINEISTAKFGVTYDKTKVDMVKTDETTVVSSYQNFDFMNLSDIETVASYTYVPVNYRKTLKVLVHSLPNLYYASAGFDLILPTQNSSDYNPTTGQEFTATLKFKVKAGESTSLTALKTYFALSGEVSAPTLIVAGGKKFIPVSGNFADAYVAPSIAYLDYTAIDPNDPIPSPSINFNNPVRTTPTDMSATFISQDDFEDGIPNGTVTQPTDDSDAISVKGGSNKYVNFDYQYGSSAPSLKYNFSQQASGQFTVEFDYFPVYESTGPVFIIINGKDNDGNASTEKPYVHFQVSKSIINNLFGNGGNSGTVFYENNNSNSMLAGTATRKYKLQINIKPEEQSYDVYIDGFKTTKYSYDFRHKGDITSSYSADYPPIGEVKFTSLQITTVKSASTYKAGFDNITAYGGLPQNLPQPTNEYYVSPSGSDSNFGTESLPFKTLERARYVVRLFNSYMTNDITIYLEQGDYYLNSTFQLTNEDSGTNGYKIIYKNKGTLSSSNPVKIIGGERLTSWTSVASSDIYKTDVGKDLTIDNIYENEKLARVARYPNFKPDLDYRSSLGSYLLSHSGDTGGAFIKYFQNDINTSGWNTSPTSLPSDAKVVWWAFEGIYDWGMARNQISSIDITNRKINFSIPWQQYDYGTGANERYYIEGIYELMDVPGEFYYDKPNGYLYYYPMDGNPNNSNILLPKLTDIITVTGSSIGNRVENISFEGLYFYGSKFTDAVETGAGITLKHTENIDIKNCHFKNLGSHAIKMYEDNESNNVYGCWIEHMGVGGIYIRNPLNRNDYPNNKSQYNTVSNCKIHDYTDIFITASNSAGVTLLNTNDCEVSYCEIFNGGRYATSLRGNWFDVYNDGNPIDNNYHYSKGNIFKYLKIHNCGTDSGDMGVVHAANANEPNGPNINYWEQITINNNSANPSMQDIRPSGIFLDHKLCTENQNFKNIKISNNQGLQFRTNGNPDQTTDNVSWIGTFNDSYMDYNNIEVKSDFPSVYGTSTTPNPSAEPDTLPNEIVIDNSDAGYSETGTWFTSNIQSCKNETSRYNYSQSATNTAKWTPTIIFPGLYDVYVWKFGSDPIGNPAAKYYVNSDGRKAVYTINQRLISYRWEKLGTHYFNAGTSGNVTLAWETPYYVESGECIRADAVKFVPVSINNNVPNSSVYYVSPNGNDMNPGTESLPFKTLEMARNVVRQYNSNMTNDITIYLEQGDYYLNSTFQLTNVDSGTNGYKIIYKNKGTLSSSNPVKIIGGERLTSWTLVASNIYKAYVGTDLTIDNIYENEKLARVARYPNFKPDLDYRSSLGSYLFSHSGDTNGAFIKYFENDLNPSGWTKFTLPSTAKVVWWNNNGTSDIGMVGSQISSVDSDITQRKINFTTPNSNSTGANERYYIEGIYELMDVPGEFYYDEPNGYLYYYPMDGNPNNSDILLPKLTDIITVTGSSIGNRVENISFEGLYFYGSKFTLSEETGAGITLKHTENIDIKNCHFKNLGSHAIKMYEDNESNNVYGCWIEHMGVGGIYIRNPLNRNDYPNNKSQYNTVSNCKIHDYTDIFITATISAGVTLLNTNDCDVSYCEIFNGGRYATSLRGHFEQQGNDNGLQYSKGNTIKYLKIYNCATDSGNVGAIYVAGVNNIGGLNENNFEQIYVNNITANPSMQDTKPNGIFLDYQNYCENQNFTNIRVVNTQGISFRTNNNSNQNFANVSWTGTFNDSYMDYTNIGVKSDFPSVYGTSTTPNPSAEPDTLPNEIVIDNSDAGYSETGTWSTSNIQTCKNQAGRYNNSQSATNTAKWTPNIPIAGLYDVYVWKFISDPIGNPAAKYYVNFNGQQVMYTINQRLISYRWEKLGTHYFNAGTSGNVTLKCDIANDVYSGATRADAVKFVPIIPNDAVGYWAFNEGSGTTAFDLTTNALNGTLVNGPIFNTSTGRLGGSLIFDGANDFVEVNDNNNIDIETSDFSISLWFKRHSNSATNLRLISKGADSDSDTGYCIFSSNTGVNVMIANGSISRFGVSANHLGVDIWNHLVVNIDRDNEMTLYLNGIEVSSVNISSINGSNISNSRKLNFGRSVSGSYLYWDGELDDVRIFKRVLSTSEISALYNATN